MKISFVWAAATVGLAFGAAPMGFDAQCGEKTIPLPRKVGCVTDLLTGAVIARDADSFTAMFAPPTRASSACRMNVREE